VKLAREAAVDEARHDDAARLASFLSPTRRATSRRRIRNLQTHDDRRARTRLSALSRPTQHDVAAHVEGDRRRVEVDNQSGHVSHIESAIHGRLSYVVQRYALANFPAMSDYHSDLPTSHLLYLDGNSLYTTYHIYPLPVGRFRFLTNAELLAFEVAGVPADSPMGYAKTLSRRTPRAA